MPQISPSTVVFLVAALMVLVGLAGLAPTILGAFARGRRLTAELESVEEERRRLATFLGRDDADADGEPGDGTPALDKKDNAPAAGEDSASGQAQAPVQPRGEDVDLTENGLLALFKEVKVVHAAPEALLNSVESISIADLLAEARVTRLLIAPGARSRHKGD